MGYDGALRVVAMDGDECWHVEQSLGAIFIHDESWCKCELFYALNVLFP